MSRHVRVSHLLVSSCSPREHFSIDCSTRSSVKFNFKLHTYALIRCVAAQMRNLWQQNTPTSKDWEPGDDDDKQRKKSIGPETSDAVAAAEEDEETAAVTSSRDEGDDDNENDDDDDDQESKRSTMPETDNSEFTSDARKQDDEKNEDIDMLS